MRKAKTRVPVERKDEIESRLSSGESLRSIARTMDVTYQALQYHRQLWGSTPLKHDLRKGPDHPNWKGGVSIDKWGYRLVYAPERLKTKPYTYEHVLVAEKAIGRRLLPNEHVHHINGDKLDNRPENLLVCTASQHRTLHQQLEGLALQLVATGVIVFEDGAYRFR